MRKFVVSSLALVSLALPSLAADLPSQKEAPAVLAVTSAYNWTGFYAGAQLGGLFGSGTYYAPANGTAHKVDDSGVFGGAHVGFNYQINAFVLGLQTEFNGAGSKGSTYDAHYSEGFTNSVNWVGSLDGRLGYSVDRALVYAIGGLAYGDIQHHFINVDLINTNFSSTRVGYDVGGGAEYALTDQWRVRIEYRYYNFGSSAWGPTPEADGRVIKLHNFTQSDNSVRVGVSYNFGVPGALFGKY